MSSNYEIRERLREFDGFQEEMCDECGYRGCFGIAKQNVRPLIRIPLSVVMLLAGEDSIREIIPFPMNKNAQDILMGAPSEVTQKQLDELHIAVTAHEE